MVKDTILYSVIFIMTFVVITFVIYNLNNKYENIFQFDFRLAEQVSQDDSLKSQSHDNVVEDMNIDIEKNDDKTAQLKESFEETKNQLAQTSQALIEKQEELDEIKKLINDNNDNKHAEWLKSTVKLYEEMESRKAGELIRLLPENEARELIYSMKKKRAAEILSNLDTETVKRLTRAIQ